MRHNERLYRPLLLIVDAGIRRIALDLNCTSCNEVDYKGGQQ